MLSMRGSRGGQGVQNFPEKSQNIGFLSNTGPDTLKNHNATEQAFNVGPSLMTFRWRPMMARF